MHNFSGLKELKILGREGKILIINLDKLLLIIIILLYINPFFIQTLYTIDIEKDIWIFKDESCKYNIIQLEKR